MEVRGRQPSQPTAAQERFLDAQADVATNSLARVRRARQVAVEFARLEKGAGSDHVELSSAAHALASHEQTPATSERVDRLREEFDRDQLNTPERIQRAAERLLGRNA